MDCLAGRCAPSSRGRELPALWSGPTRRRLLVGLAAVLVLVAGCTDDPEPAKPAAASAPSPPPATKRPAPPAEQPITLAFGGDVHFEGALGERLANDPSSALTPIAGILGAADLAMVNLETAVTTRGVAVPKEFNFRAPPEAFAALDAAGIDVATMANNHGMDYGMQGLEDSMAAAKAAGFPVVGIGREADEAFAARTFTVKGQKVAVIGATQVLDSSLKAAWSAGDGKPGLASAYDTQRLVAAVERARSRHDTVVVFLHWGQQGNSCPLARQRELARRLVDAGADVIVGSHAHVLLGGGRMGKAYVHYGLGNFAFYARGGLGAQTGVLVLTVRGRQVLEARWRPAVISGGVPRPLSGAAAARARASWQSLRGCTGLAPAA
jgi:poly-gamma-glutamate capsule biosynthesis protein CapA/YwtB (metallophosphatase superfamily)